MDCVIIVSGDNFVFRYAGRGGWLSDGAVIDPTAAVKELMILTVFRIV